MIQRRSFSPPTFNPAAQVVIESPTSNLQPPTSNFQSPTPNLFYTDYRAGHFTVVAQTSLPAYLVFSEVWYPSWTATINDKPAQILRANTAFMAVEVPSGESTVTFNFTSPTLTIGVIITLVTLLHLSTSFSSSNAPPHELSNVQRPTSNLQLPIPNLQSPFSNL